MKPLLLTLLLSFTSFLAAQTPSPPLSVIQDEGSFDSSVRNAINKNFSLLQTSNNTGVGNFTSLTVSGAAAFGTLSNLATALQICDANCLHKTTIGGYSSGLGFAITGPVQATQLQTATVCANAASPAVCGSAAAGSAVIPAASTSSSVVVDTTAVTASSTITLTVDSSLTVGAATCNTTAATLAIPPYISARTPGTSFTISYLGTISTNPVCVSYSITN